MCKCSEVQDFIRKVDYTFYQNLVEVLMPDVLRPIPSEYCDAKLALSYYSIYIALNVQKSDYEKIGN